MCPPPLIIILFAVIGGRFVDGLMVAIPTLNMISTPFVEELACSIAARRVQVLAAVLQRPSPKLASSWSPVESTTKLTHWARDVSGLASTVHISTRLTASASAF